jgi:hypothetical protein
LLAIGLKENEDGSAETYRSAEQERIKIAERGQQSHPAPTKPAGAGQNHTAAPGFGGRVEVCWANSPFGGALILKKGNRESCGCIYHG